MEQAIKKAIEGGYDIEAGYRQCKSVGDRDRFALLDPLFWQALGKQQGWKRIFVHSSYGVTNEEMEIFEDIDKKQKFGFMYDGDDENDFSIAKSLPEWKYRMIRFTLHIADGGDIDEFFNKILKDNT